MTPTGRLLVFLLPTVVTSSVARAQYATLEWSTADADVIYVARADSAGRGAGEMVLRPAPGITAIRGTPPEVFEPRNGLLSGPLVTGSESLVFFKFIPKEDYGGDPPPAVPELNTADARLVPLDGSAKEFTLWMQPVSSRESLLNVVRDAAKTIAQHPQSLELQDPPIPQMSGGIRAPSIQLPICPALERSAHALIDHPRDWADRAFGLAMLAPFKSDENIRRARALLNDPEIANVGNQATDWPNRLDRIWTSPYPVRQAAAWLLQDTWGLTLPEHVETRAEVEPYRKMPAAVVLIPAALVLLAFAAAPVLGRRRRRQVLIGVWSLLSILLAVAWLRTRGGGVDRFAYPTRWGEFELAINPGQIRLLHVSDHPEPFGLLHCRLEPPVFAPDDLWISPPMWLVRPSHVWGRRGFTTSRGTVRASETSEYAFRLWAVPVWLVLWICLAYPLFRSASALAAWARPRRRPPGACRSCGYDLTGNVSGACPECGRAVVVLPGVSK